MSLFGDDTDSPVRPKSSLFDGEETAKPKIGSSMFGDTPAEADETSPWGFTPKKNTGRRSLVKSLLVNADIPDIYIDTFDALQAGGNVSASVARQFLGDCGIGVSAQSQSWDLVSNRGESTALGRDEFNVLLALIGLAQEGEELSLDAVDERRKKLPRPSLPAPKLQQAQPPPTPQSQARLGASASPEQPKDNVRKTSFGAGFGDNDPWASPAAAQRAHGHLNGVTSTVPQRTTSNFTTGAAEPSDTTSSGAYSGTVASNSETMAWGGNTYTAGETSGLSGTPSGGAGGFGGGDSSPTVPRRAVPARATSKGAEEVVTVNLLDEKEGMFMFQHRNYEVASVRRNSKVIRRYSDFVWLLDCLYKRYPFRQLPLLPPKRVQINGNHLAADASFLEKRRRGLARFANALVRHPVLREEQLVVMFLTVPTELAVWRKQATISVQEEFTGKSLPPSLEDSLPQNLQDTFDTVRSGVRRSADLYINLCNLVERLCKREEAIASEFSRFSLNLNSLTETSTDTYAIDPNDVLLLNEGIKGTAKHLGTAQALVEDEARAWDEGLLEDLKTMRDSLVSMRDMFDRRDKFARDNIPQLERKIQQNEEKLQAIKAKGPAAKPGEEGKVADAIIKDKQSIVDQHARGVFIKECIRDELLYFQSTQYRVSRLHQDWAQERVKYAELQADNFRGLVDAVESMPLGDYLSALKLRFRCWNPPKKNDTMPKKRSSTDETELSPVPKKKKKSSNSPSTGSYNNSQKSAISEFTQVTQSDKNIASKLLKQHNWNVGAAVNAFFSGPTSGPNPLRGNINKVFDKFRDDPRNEPDEINPEGVANILAEMGIGLDDIGSFVFSELVQSPSLGKVTREGFMEGCLDVSADSVPKIRNVVLQRRSQLGTDREVFRNVYNHAFVLGLSNNQKSLALEVATEFWTLLFSKAGYEWRTSKTPWLDWWLEFQQNKWKKAINKDLWRQTLTFAEETMKDESLGFWNEEASWPSVIDDFVEWVKTEKRPTDNAAGDAMDVE